jgi:hypothetical protein
MQPQRSTVVAQRAIAIRNQPDVHEKENDAARTEAHATAPVWDFSKVPVFSPDCAERFQNPAPFRAPHLPGPIRGKLEVGGVDDPLEREADRVADQVTLMSAPEVSLAAAPPQISRKCAACEEEEKLQKKPIGPQGGAGVAPDVVHEVLRSPGQPLDPASRAYFEPRFGHDFSQVRVHADARAADSAQAIRARAYTVGCDIVFGAGQYDPGSEQSRKLLAHELTHTIQQSASVSTMNTTVLDSGTVQRQPKDPKSKAGEPKAEEKDKPVPAEGKGPSQQVYVVRDKGLQLGGTLVSDLEEFKRKVMATKIEADWTLVLSMHGSEERLGAQAPPDWQKNAIFYEASNIETLFNGDKDFVKWRDRYGPTFLSLVSCQVSASFEGTLISNLTRSGSKRQEKRGLGEGCKPIATAQTLIAAPKTRAEFDKLPQDKRNAIRTQLSELNKVWGYYGAPPVPDDQVVHFYYDEEPKGEWVQVEVMVGKGHTVDELKKTGIPYWNRTTGDKAAEFRRLCDQGVGKLKREHTPAVPDVPD